MCNYEEPTRRLKKVLMESGLTIEDFSKLCKVSRSAMKNYLDGRLPQSDQLISICRACDVSADWLLGLSDVSNPSAELKGVCEYTGLTETAVTKITNHRFSNHWDKILSHMIVSDGFETLMTDYGTFLDSAERLSTANLEEPEFELNEEGRVVLSRNEATHHFMRKVSLAMIGICHEDYYNSFDMASKNTHQKWLEHIDSIVKKHRTNDEEE